jgi:thioredoxin 1
MAEQMRNIISNNLYWATIVVLLFAWASAPHRVAAKGEQDTLGKVTEVTDENFVEEVEQSTQLVMVLFDWKAEDASRCRPCRVIAPIVEQLAQDYAGKVKVVRIEAETNPKTSAQFRIIGVPAILFFKNGKLVDKEIGDPPSARKVLEEKIKEHLN